MVIGNFIITMMTYSLSRTNFSKSEHKNARQ